MAATIKDVAQRARVSTASVSRVLNGSGVVSEPTRQRVLRAAQHLHYTPHEAARSLITRRTHTIGVLLPDLDGDYFSEFMHAIHREAQQGGLHLLVSGAHGAADEAVAALRGMHGRVDGLLIISPPAAVRPLIADLPAALPAVLVNAREDGSPATSFTSDDYGGARAMVAHLRGLGYQHIAHITGPEHNHASAERLRGFLDAMRLAPAGRDWVLQGAFSAESGYLAGRQIAAARPRPEAVFAASDMAALGCLFALAEAGLRVPEDIALAGFDDLPMAPYLSPPLTTVRTQAAELGRRSLEALARTIKRPGEATGERHTLATQLVIRASCLHAGTAGPR